MCIKSGPNKPDAADLAMGLAVREQGGMPLPIILFAANKSLRATATAPSVLTGLWNLDIVITASVRLRWRCRSSGVRPHLRYEEIYSRFGCCDTGT
jgi:hypothetical protein